MNKVCILSHARCRTSFLIRSFGNAYDLKNKTESYSQVKKLSFKEQIILSKVKDKEVASHDLYEKKLKKFTDELFQQNKWVIKVWPRWFNSSEFCYNVNRNVKNLEACFRFSEYDQIILSKRNPVDSVCSLDLGVKYGYNSSGSVQSNYSTKLKYSKFIDNSIHLHDWHKSFIIEICMIDTIKDYLDTKKINYDYVEFDEIPNFVAKLPHSDNTNYQIPIDTKIDYTQAIPNYDEITYTIQDYIKSIKPILNSINFE